MEHHVYFWLNEGADTHAFEQGLKSLLSVEHVESGAWGKQAETPERPVTDKTWDYALSLTFPSIEEHDHYQIDPIHDIFVENNKDRWNKVLVCDMA